MRRNNIYELRKAKGIRRPDLAKQLGVCYNTVAKWEYNSIFPALEFVEPLCEILECAEEDLFPFHKEYFKYGLDRLIKGYHVLLSREGISAPRTPSKSIRSRILYINHGCEVFRVSLKGLADAADNMDLIVPDMAKIQAFVIKNWKGTQVELADEEVDTVCL